MATSKGGRIAQRQRQSREQEEMPLRRPRQSTPADIEKFKPVFDRYADQGGIPNNEVVHIFELENQGQDLPEDMERELVRRADRNGDGRITFEEFSQMITDGGLNARLTWKQKLVMMAVSTVAPKTAKTKAGDDLVESYTKNYTCLPPPLFMVVISLAEIGVFIGYAVNQKNTYCIETTMISGAPRYTPLIYDPSRRYEAWRFFTYMFIHDGIKHILFNLIFQLLIGVPLEMVHKIWRVAIVYVLGVVAGSLASSVTDPNTLLCGASGGCYALIGAHFAAIIMNWKDMTHDWMSGPVKFLLSAPVQLTFWLIFVAIDVGVAIYTRYGADVQTQTSYAAHLGGALAGMLLGLPVLKNFTEFGWELKVKWVALGLYLALIVSAVLVNIFHTSYYPATVWTACCFTPRSLCPKVNATLIG